MAYIIKPGGKRLEVRDTKVENDNFYLLTLASAAKELDETIIQEIMAEGKSKVPEPYMEIIEDCLRKFAQKVYNTLKEHDITLTSCRLSLWAALRE